jgi:hypothetical protein
MSLTHFTSIFPFPLVAIMSSIRAVSKAATTERSIDESNLSEILSDQSKNSESTGTVADGQGTKCHIYKSVYTCDMMGDIYPKKCKPCESGESLVPGVSFSAASGACPHMKYFFGSSKASLTLFEAVLEGKVIGRASSRERLLVHLHI